MKNHRTMWAIAAATAALALGAFALRQTIGGKGAMPGHSAADRDRVVAQMIGRLEMDPRVRSAATRSLVEMAAKYSGDRALASAETWYAEGLRAYYGESNAAAAEAAFSRSAKLRPEWAWPVNGLGIVEFTEGRRGDAERSFARALELDPAWSRPHSDMAILYRRAGELGEAFNHARQALAIEPEHPVNHFNYGVILDELGRHTEARTEYERVLAAAPDMPQAAYNLACGYARQGDAGTALPYLARAIAMDEGLRDYATEDPDFDPIRKDREFAWMIHRGSQ